MRVYHNALTLAGPWVISKKIDGVQVIYSSGVPRSRADKPLYNLPTMPDGSYEAFHTDWNTTVSWLRGQTGRPLFPVDCLYKLSPKLDARLVIDCVENPTDAVIQHHFNTVLSQGYEGLVLHQADEAFKVKPIETLDVQITGFQAGKGKHTGRLGAILTTRGKIGTGFTDAERQFFWANQADLLHTTIEVECMGVNLTGKLRHARFIRMRPDKGDGRT